MNANSINRLGFRGVTLVQLIANCAKNVKARYVLTGASALIIRGVIRRETNDVDVNIAPRTSLDLQDAIRPHLSANKNEAVLVDGKTPEAKAAQRKFRIFKSFEGLPQTDNMNADISENECVMLDNDHKLVVFKICAISRQNWSGQSGKAFKDAHDLAAAVKHLRVNGELVPAEVQALFSREIPPFSWTSFWEALTVNTSDLVETLKVDLPL